VTPDELRAKLAKVPTDELVALLARLAEGDAALQERVEGLALRADPDGYAASLERRLKRFREGRSFISYRESGGFARELDAWLDDVEAGLLAADPQTAWKLVDRFIRADARILDRADDSNGSIGDSFRRACRLWHQAAAALPADPVWVERVHELHAGNDYGTRDALLDEAAIRLSPLELRRLARLYEQAATSARRDEEGHPALTAAVAMGQVACALGDAALYERSVRIRSPRPNALQADDIAAQYLRFGPVERAVEWLTGAAGDSLSSRDERLDLLAQAYEKLGNRQALLDTRRKLAERSNSPELFFEYAALLPVEEREVARGQALERAMRSDDPVSAARFLLALDEPDRASALVLRRTDGLTSSYYREILDLAQGLEKAARPLPAVACYRALVEQILAEARSKAYGHARRYVDRLTALHPSVSDYGELPSHADYLAQLRLQHGRKHSFWRLFTAESK
jgi:hypothetical protein